MSDNRTARYHSTGSADSLRIGDVVHDAETHYHRTVHAVFPGPSSDVHIHFTDGSVATAAADERFQIVQRTAAADEEFDV